MIDDPRFAGAPNLGKVAVGGRWEHAHVFTPGTVLDDTDLRELVGTSHEVACEAFFGAAFFGVRRHGPDPARFVRDFTLALARAVDGRDFFASMTRLGVDLGTDFRFAEFGAEGAWASVGPVRLADPCGADLAALWPELLASPVGRDTTHDKALEFTFGGGTTHRFALPVSEGGVLSRTAVDTALRAFCG